MPEETVTPLRQRRVRNTRAAVHVSEMLSRLLITVGGVGTIAAVALIFVFLLWVVAPLFVGAEVVSPTTAALAGPGGRGEVRRFQVDEYGLLGAVLHADGSLATVELGTGAVLATERPFGEESAVQPTALSFSGSGADAVLAAGFADGTIRTATLGFRSSFPSADELPAAVAALAPGAHAPWQGGVVQVTSDGRFRWQRVVVELEAPVTLREPAEVVCLGHARREDTTVLCAWLADGRLVHLQARERENFLTGEVDLDVQETALAVDLEPALGAPAEILVSGLGDNAFLLWGDGVLRRLVVRDPHEAVAAEVVDVVPAPDARLTAAAFMVGGTTLVVGDSSGRVGAWFRTKPADAGTVDGSILVEAHVLLEGGPAVTALAPSPRSRLLASGHDDGSVRLFHVTTAGLLGESRTDTGPLTALRMTAKEDALAALTPTGVVRWEMDPRHPEASLSALFRPVWYEGYEKPQHVWQSEGGTDDFEPKLGFLPLVFGTLKATFYTMLFGAPLALLAAIFTSEFLDRRLRVPVKSTIE